MKISVMKVLIILPLWGFCVSMTNLEERLSPKNQGYYIIVSKEKMTLTLLDSLDRIVHSYPISCGENYGQKHVLGDKKTPEGTFQVGQIQEASSWVYDFGDGKGQVEGAYGPYFIRVRTPPFKSIGIHGTHDSTTVGYRNTKGCIRLKNRDLEQLIRYVYVGMNVQIMPSLQDCKNDKIKYKVNK